MKKKGGQNPHGAKKCRGAYEVENVEKWIKMFCKKTNLKSACKTGMSIAETVLSPYIGHHEKNL